jgi:hypothetical protein
MKSKALALVVAVCAAVALYLSYLPQPTKADHSWGGYHWARRSNPFTLKVVDSNTPNWDGALSTALSDWSQSTKFDVVRDTGNADDSTRTRKQCKMVAGKIRSCNASYGFNQWLGLATISISGGEHITQATTKMNDSYLNSSSYSSTNRQHVMCQEIGHDFGLDHQDESGADLGTCMDYSNDLGNPHPNNHDYEELNLIYSHTDSSTTIAALTFGTNEFNEFGDDPDAPHNWGRLVSQSANGRSSTYERVNSNGTLTVRHVFWTQEAAERCAACDHRYDH